MVSDREAIDRVANLWINMGCDSIGFEWVSYKILERIRTIERENKSNGNDD